MGVFVSQAVDVTVAAILKRVTERPESFQIFGEQTLKNDLEIDSLQMIDIVLLVESELEIEMGDEFTRDLVTVDDLQKYVSELVGG